MAVCGQFRVVGTEPHRSAEITAGFTLLQPLFGHPFGDDADHRLIGFTEFGGGRLRITGFARGFDAGHLHTQADAEERHLALACETHRGDLALAPALAKATRHENRVHRFELGGDVGILALEDLGIDPLHIDLDAVRHPAVNQRFVERLVGILQADIFADDADGNLAFGIGVAIGHVVPARQVGIGGVGDTESAQHFGVEAFAVILQRHRIDRGRV